MDKGFSILLTLITDVELAQTTWNSWRKQIHLETVNIGVDTDDITLIQSNKMLKYINDLRKVVDIFLVDIEEEARLLKTKLMPAVLHRGINSLPDEILQMVLNESARSSDGSQVLAIQLSCKRFDAAIRASADGWSLVTNATKLSKIRLSQLNARKVSPIDVSTTDRASVRKSFTEFICLNTDRLRNIEWEGDERLGSEFNTIFMKERDIVSVKSLRINDYNGFPKWTFSQLLDLDCDMIPSPGSFPLLRHWNLRRRKEEEDDTYSGRRVYVPHDGDKILSFLHTTPLLQSLGLSLDSEKLIEMSGHRSVTLANVESLTINYRCYSRNSNIFMDRLKLSRVKWVFFNAEAMSGLNTFFGTKAALVTVKSLELNNIPTYEEKQRLKNIPLLQSYDEIYRIFPGLERLDIRTQGYLFWYNPNATYWKNLHTVSFWHDADFWNVNLSSLVSSKTFASGLKHLRVYGPPLEEAGDYRVDTSIRKILENVYGEAALEVQPGIMGSELDYKNLLRLRPQVRAVGIA